MVVNAREDWNTFSYFVVTKSNGRKTEELFVSGDWPTAGAYVKLMGLPGRNNPEPRPVFSRPAVVV